MHFGKIHSKECYYDKIDENLIKKQLRGPKEQQYFRALMLNHFEKFFAINISNVLGKRAG